MLALYVFAQRTAHHPTYMFDFQWIYYDILANKGLDILLLLDVGLWLFITDGKYTAAVIKGDSFSSEISRKEMRLDRRYQMIANQRAHEFVGQRVITINNVNCP